MNWRVGVRVQRRRCLRSAAPLPAAISIVALREFAEGFLDPVALNEFVSPFRIVQLSRIIAWRTALLQTSLCVLAKTMRGSLGRRMEQRRKTGKPTNWDGAWYWDIFVPILIYRDINVDIMPFR